MNSKSLGRSIFKLQMHSLLVRDIRIVFAKYAVINSALTARFRGIYHL